MLLYGGMWKNLGLWTKKVVKHCKRILMGHLSRSLEDNAESNVACGGSALVVSEENNISSWVRNHSCDVLVKNVAALPLS